jgi:hypothetical protein
VAHPNPVRDRPRMTPPRVLWRLAVGTQGRYQVPSYEELLEYQYSVGVRVQSDSWGSLE